MIDNQKLDLILASNSQGRKALLTGADIKFKAHAANIDEAIIKTRNQSLGFPPAQTAQDLADAKALFVSKQYPSKLTLGSDQVCHLNGDIIDKPGSTDRLFAHIEKLNGKTHILTSAISIAQNGKIIFRYSDDAHLTMYNLSADEIKNYVNRASEQVVNAAGGYHLEAIGVQLFKNIDGSYFTILGLPLLPLIEFLRGSKAN
ncbi:MAG: Maf-like protein [Rhizobiales bacterium]|nr:Maf family protein [Hyphomicrobiales bacterium]NRB15197.1 Maf-like protein [Hyphomicrobiales bacterium]